MTKEEIEQKRLEGLRQSRESEVYINPDGLVFKNLKEYNDYMKALRGNNWR